jgi:acetyl esterase/lipase
MLDIKRRIGTALLDLLVSRRGYRVERNLPYGSHPRQKLDVYVPNDMKTAAPVILFFYGGSWQSGDKGWYRAFGEAFASQGIVVAIADYRLYPEALYPAFLDDCALALRFVRERAANFGGDPASLFLAGHSAGAYNATMLVCSPNHLHALGGDASWVRGIIGIAGPYDFLPLKDKKLIEIFGGDRRAETQPITHINKAYPPMLLVAGSKDRTVSWKNTKRMSAKLREFGTDVTEIVYPGVGHIEIILSVARLLRGRTRLREDIASFVRKIAP